MGGDDVHPFVDSDSDSEPGLETSKTKNDVNSLFKSPIQKASQKDARPAPTLGALLRGAEPSRKSSNPTTRPAANNRLSQVSDASVIEGEISFGYADDRKSKAIGREKERRRRRKGSRSVSRSPTTDKDTNSPVQENRTLVNDQNKGLSSNKPAALTGLTALSKDRVKPRPKGGLLSNILSAKMSSSSIRKKLNGSKDGSSRHGSKSDLMSTRTMSTEADEPAWGVVSLDNLLLDPSKDTNVPGSSKKARKSIMYDFTYFEQQMNMEPGKAKFGQRRNTTTGDPFLLRKTVFGGDDDDMEDISNKENEGEGILGLMGGRGARRGSVAGLGMGFAKMIKTKNMLSAKKAKLQEKQKQAAKARVMSKLTAIKMKNVMKQSNQVAPANTVKPSEPKKDATSLKALSSVVENTLALSVKHKKKARLARRHTVGTFSLILGKSKKRMMVRSATVSRFLRTATSDDNEEEELSLKETINNDLMESRKALKLYAPDIVEVGMGSHRSLHSRAPRSVVKEVEKMINLGGDPKEWSGAIGLPPPKQARGAFLLESELKATRADDLYLGRDMTKELQHQEESAEKYNFEEMLYEIAGEAGNTGAVASSDLKERQDCIPTEAKGTKKVVVHSSVRGEDDTMGRDDDTSGKDPSRPMKIYTGLYLRDRDPRFEVKVVDEDGDGTGVCTWATVDGSALKSKAYAYKGGFKDGKFHGKGIMTWVNGDRFVGQFQDHVKIGEGMFEAGDGRRYRGQFENDVMHGRGRHDWPDGRWYEGQFNRGKIEGIGVMHYRDNRAAFLRRNKPSWRYYQGRFAQDLPHGKGRVTFSNGVTYEGTFSKGKMSGDGIYYYLDGGRYVGQVVNGKKHGFGYYYSSTGAQYRGMFENGLPNGRGVMFLGNKKRNSASDLRHNEVFDGYYRNGKVHGLCVHYFSTGYFKGYFNEGIIDGNGRMEWSDGRKYVGEFKNNEISGRGCFTWPSGAKYEGEFLNGCFHGVGKSVDAKGNKYAGHYKAGKKHGEGRDTTANGGVFVGTFKNNQRWGAGVFTTPSGQQLKLRYRGEYGEGTINYADGSMYMGEFANELRQGKGLYIWQSGDRYWGQFISDHMEGQGTVYTRDGYRYKGNMKKGTVDLILKFHENKCKLENEIAIERTKLDLLGKSVIVDTGDEDSNQTRINDKLGMEGHRLRTRRESNYPVVVSDADVLKGTIEYAVVMRNIEREKVQRGHTLKRLGEELEFTEKMITHLLTKDGRRTRIDLESEFDRMIMEDPEKIKDLNELPEDGREGEETADILERMKEMSCALDERLRNVENTIEEIFRSKEIMDKTASLPPLPPGGHDEPEISYVPDDPDELLPSHAQEQAFKARKQTTNVFVLLPAVKKKWLSLLKTRKKDKDMDAELMGHPMAEPPPPIARKSVDFRRQSASPSVRFMESAA